MQNVIAILDIGKTNSKINILESKSVKLLETVQKKNTVLQSSHYTYLDTDGLWLWIKAQLKILLKKYNITGISVTTHGATFACLSDDDLVFPILDYENPIYQEYNHTYNRLRPDFLESFSPNLANGLNAGRQIYWLYCKFPKQFTNVKCIIPYPQYWCWKLTGKIVNEVTSMGCHTDLYNPQDNDLSTMVKILKWDNLFPKCVAAGCHIGDVKSTVCAELKSNTNIPVYNGIHDSNATFVPYLKSDVSVVSTGTWIVVSAINGSKDTVKQNQDMQCFVSAKNSLIPVMRFMGGREWHTLKGKTHTSQWNDIEYIVESDIYVLPSFSSNGGPFAHSVGYIENEDKIITDSQQTALATLYCAYMTYYCLTYLGGKPHIVIEGPFTKNHTYMQVLQILNQNRGTVHYTQIETGTAVGLLHLINSNRVLDTLPPLNKIRINVNPVQILTHYQKWVSKLSYL